MGVLRFYLFFWSRLPIFIFLLHFASIFCLGATLAMELSSFTPLFSFILFYLLAYNYKPVIDNIRVFHSFRV
jgi:hypothetical protein